MLSEQVPNPEPEAKSADARGRTFHHSAPRLLLDTMGLILGNDYDLLNF